MENKKTIRIKIVFIRVKISTSKLIKTGGILVKQFQQKEIKKFIDVEIINVVAK